ncbi:MAG: hypothetical protein ABIS20_03270 [Thermoanaerobaculia bacterium]
MKIAGISWGRKETKTLTGESVFTSHVRVLAGRESLDPRRLEQLWSALRAALRSELKRRGLWETPPAYLGIYGWEAWEAWGEGGRKETALEELLAECYSYIFVLRLRSLEAQLKLKENIDGLIFLNIRHFLHERQKEHDPLGSQVFQVLQSAVRTAVAEGDLYVLEGDERIRNLTVLSVSASGPALEPAREGLAALVARWNDELLPDLVTLRGHRQEEVVRRLRERLTELGREGFATFRFKDLVDPLKADVRARWAAILDQSQGEAVPRIEEESRGTRARLVPPDTQIEERQLFRKLVDCVMTSLRRLDINEKTRDYLSTLWNFVRLQASEGEEPGAPALRLDPWLEEAEGEERPSLRRLAEQLRIPRERLPGLYETLGDLLERCRAANSGRTAVRSLLGKSRPGKSRPGNSSFRNGKGGPGAH